MCAVSQPAGGLNCGGGSLRCPSSAAAACLLTDEDRIQAPGAVPPTGGCSERRSWELARRGRHGEETQDRGQDRAPAHGSDGETMKRRPRGHDRSPRRKHAGRRIGAGEAASHRSVKEWLTSAASYGGVTPRRAALGTSGRFTHVRRAVAPSARARVLRSRAHGNEARGVHPPARDGAGVRKSGRE
jgi:hypothetical protein